jgi:hypothetical protein
LSLTTVASNCTTGLPTDEIESTTSGSGLSYQGNGVWQYNWKTTGLTGCRTLNLRLTGNPTPQPALFNIRP